MISLTNYYKSPSLLKFLSIVAVSSNVWTIVQAQNDDYDDGSDEDGSEDGTGQEDESQDDSGQEDENQDDTATTSYNDGQWTPDATTTTTYNILTATTDPNAPATLTVDPSLSTDPPISASTTEAIIPPTPTQDVQSTNINSSTITTTITSTSPSAIDSPVPQIDSLSVNKGTIAGAVVGGVVGAGLIGAFMFLLLRKLRAKKSAADREVFTPQADDDEYQDGWKKSESSGYPPLMSVASPTEPAPQPPQHTHHQNY
ncbi:hypothetical protein [Parasitella parasitica]|uniref:Mid2 domain-containing protein n=1 Tax=Parasitella parasitica TaxID=35722 RepID=A0A0B7N5S3_9FUNG|nr:hypothetical protein [Parasitella parasitica]